MRTITVEVPDELADELAEMRERLPELLALSLQQPAVPAELYRIIVTFLASAPTPEEIKGFQPPSAMQQRLRTLLERSRSGNLTSAEQAELDELERIEHLMIMLKAGLLSVPAPSR